MADVEVLINRSRKDSIGEEVHRINRANALDGDFFCAKVVDSLLLHFLQLFQFVKFELLVITAKFVGKGVDLLKLFLIMMPVTTVLFRIFGVFELDICRSTATQTKNNRSIQFVKAVEELLREDGASEVLDDLAINNFKVNFSSNLLALGDWWVILRKYQALLSQHHLQPT